MDISVNYHPHNPNELCCIMEKYGSDKGKSDGNGHHNYTSLYYELFSAVRNDKLRIFELGLGTNNTDVASNMGVNGKPGASLRGWKEFFPNSSVFGADIDKRILFQEDRIKTYYCDQTSPEVIKSMWEEEELKEDFDIIVEDGLHTFEANVCFFENSFHKVKKGGVYIIEDVYNHLVNIYHKWLSVKGLKYRIEILPSYRNNADNTLIIISK